MMLGVMFFHTLISLCFLSASRQARVKRCYVCRSRGELGDCRDPFPFNATTVEAVRAVEATPCASGWCAKIVEGKKDEYAIATERMCLQRPPGDEEPRCSPTLYKNKKVFMCFCKGDLCNKAGSISPTRMLILATVVVFGLSQFFNRAFL